MRHGTKCARRAFLTAQGRENGECQREKKVPEPAVSVLLSEVLQQILRAFFCVPLRRTALQQLIQVTEERESGEREAAVSVVYYPSQKTKTILLVAEGFLTCSVCVPRVGS